MNDELRNQIVELLGECRTASLATSRPGHDQPFACNVQFAFNRDMQLFFVSSPDSDHGVHIALGSAVALTVYSHTDDDPSSLRGLQMRGRCEPIPRCLGDGVSSETSEVNPKWAGAHEVYAARFPFIDQQPYSRAMASNLFYRVTPAWIRLIDNRQGFGFKREMTL